MTRAEEYDDLDELTEQDSRSITIHKPEDYEGMRKAGHLAAEVLDMLADHVRPGITTETLNTLAHEMILSRGAVPAPLNYRGYPKSICTSLNHVVCHGIPDEKPLKDGDILNIDVTVILDGWYGDSSRMYWAGKPSVRAQRLTEVTYEALMRGIEQVRPGATLGDIGYAIQSFAERHNYSIVRDYCGHGLGRVFHAAPNVVHYGRPGTGTVLREGMFFTIEPMINVGKAATLLSRHDGWTVTTRDKSLSAQFEHSLAVTRDGYEIFTASPKGLHFPPYGA